MYCNHCNRSIGVINGVTCPHCNAPLYKGKFPPPSGYRYDAKTSLCYREQAISGNPPVREVTWFDPFTGASRACHYPAPPARKQMPSRNKQSATATATAPPNKKRPKGKGILAACLIILLLAGGVSVWYFRLYTMLPFWNPSIEGVEISPPNPENLPVFVPLNTYNNPA